VPKYFLFNFSWLSAGLVQLAGFTVQNLPSISLLKLDTANKLCQSVSNPADEIAEVFSDEVPGMLEVFANTGFRRHSPAQFTFKQGETDMGDKGKKDKGKREQQKKAQLTPKEKRKLKKEKKQ
jgi:hypothetical protein